MVIFCSANTTSIEAMIVQRRLRWSGHVIRMRENRLLKAILHGELSEGRCRVGGIKKRYKDQLKSDLKTSDISPDQLEALAQDRSRWLQVCQPGVQTFEQRSNDLRQERRERRRKVAARPAHPAPQWLCETCGRQCASRFGLNSDQRAHARLQE